jgi:hypothetical protein
MNKFQRGKKSELFNNDTDMYSVLVAGHKPDSVQQSVMVGHADDMHHHTAHLVKYACNFICTLSLNEYSWACT